MFSFYHLEKDMIMHVKKGAEKEKDIHEFD